jgi:hypothetical protein
MEASMAKKIANWAIKFPVCLEMLDAEWVSIVKALLV